jgi:hypothetical protein
VSTEKDFVAWALQVDVLSVDKLLADWRWFCPEPFSLVARNAFGDLFLRDAEGKIFWLEVASGELTGIAISQSEFIDLLGQDEKQEAWLAKEDTQSAFVNGLEPDMTQCIGFKIPLVFAESRNTPDNAYIADLYEQVSFLGDLHRRLSIHPDGAKVELVVKLPTTGAGSQ